MNYRKGIELIYNFHTGFIFVKQNQFWPNARKKTKSTFRTLVWVFSSLRSFQLSQASYLFTSSICFSKCICQNKCNKYLLICIPSRLVILILCPTAPGRFIHVFLWEYCKLARKRLFFMLTSLFGTSEHFSVFANILVQIVQFHIYYFFFISHFLTASVKTQEQSIQDPISPKAPFFSYFYLERKLVKVNIMSISESHKRT